MRVLALDVETTTFQKGNPFSQRNKLICVGLHEKPSTEVYPIEYGAMPYAKELETIQHRIESADLLIGFNIKFDLHWLRRYIPGIRFPRIWDCQLAQYIIENQARAYVSLDECTGGKDRTIETEYWNKGIDTDKIPWDIIRDRNRIDCELTHSLYLHQRDTLSATPNKLTLLRLHCADLLVLQEMEYNGLKYNTKRSSEEGIRVGELLQSTKHQLDQLTNEPRINWNSPQQVSAVLYGGAIKFPCREETQRTLKDGSVKIGSRNGTTSKTFDRLVEPIKGTELDRGFSTAEPTLRSLPTNRRDARSIKAKEIIDLVLKVSELDKLLGTYYNGLPNLITEMDWEKDTLHGQINQAVTRTGRTSSSRPNLQNFDKRLKPLFYSRFSRGSSIGVSESN